MCFCFFLGNFALEDFLQNLLPPRFSFQVETTQEQMGIRAICHWSVFLPGEKDRGGGWMQTHYFWKREDHLRASAASGGLQGRSSWLFPAQRGPARPAPAF